MSCQWVNRMSRLLLPSLTEVRVGVGRVGSGVGVGGVCRVGGVGSGSGVGSSVGCAVSSQWGSCGVGHWGSNHGWLGSDAGHDGEQAESELGGEGSIS